MSPVPLRLSPGSRSLRGGIAADSALLEVLSPSAVLAETPMPAAARGVVWMVAGLLASCVVAAQLIAVDRVVTATGRVVSTAPTIVVQPLETAVVRAIAVHEGQRVRAGDALARLDPTFASADADALARQVADLEAEVARLRAEIAGAPYVAADVDPASVLQAAIFARRQSERVLKMESYRQKIEGLTASAAHSEIDARTLRERLGLAQDVEAMRRTLAQDQVGSRLNWLVATDNRLEVERNLFSSEATSASTRTDLAALIAERDAYAQNWLSQAAQSLSEQSRKLSDAREQLKKARLRQAMVDLRADRDATVLTIAKVSEGSVLQPGERFLTLVPADVPLEVEVSVSGRDNGFLAVGDPAQIKFDSFPYARHGMGEGFVRAISPDSFTPADQQNARAALDSPPADSAHPFYRARISIDRAALRHVPADFHIIPGMPVTTDVTVGRHSVLSYLLERLLTVPTEAMREP